MSLSLLDSLLPAADTAGRVKIDKILHLPKTGKPEQFGPNYQKNVRLAQLCLTVAAETATAISESRYKDFDALVKNFGCQITARQVERLMGFLEPLRAEAKELQGVAQEKLEKTKQFLNRGAPVGTLGATVVDYLRSVQLDIAISPAMAELVRLRLLCIVNSNRLVGEKETPYTNIDQLTKRVKKIDTNIVKNLVESLQVEEARRAASFIQGEAAILEGERAPFLQRLLAPGFVRTSGANHIDSLPLLYNTEASIRGTQGTLLVKNKLFLINKPIPGAEPTKVYFKMPAMEVMNGEEVDALPADAPLIVVEGFVQRGISLSDKIQEVGLLNLIKINCAQLPQYASDTDQSALGDEEAAREICQLQGQAARAAFLEIDHIYCASVKEER